MNISPRQQVAQNFVDTCVCSGLGSIYGVTLSKVLDNGQPHWAINFGAAGLDGLIKVYSPVFIIVKWKGRAKGLLTSGSEKFTSELKAKSFIITHFGS